MRIYVAGGMKGIPYYNFPAFDGVRDALQMLGHEVRSPADMDRAIGFDGLKCKPDTDWSAIPDGFDFEACVTRDIEAVRWCDAIYMLPGWESSKGAKAELALASWIGKKIEYYGRD